MHADVQLALHTCRAHSVHVAAYASIYLELPGNGRPDGPASDAALVLSPVLARDSRWHHAHLLVERTTELTRQAKATKDGAICAWTGGACRARFTIPLTMVCSSPVCGRSTGWYSEPKELCGRRGHGPGRYSSGAAPACALYLYLSVSPTAHFSIGARASTSIASSPSLR